MKSTRRIKLICKRWGDIGLLTIIAVLCCPYLEFGIQKFAALLRIVGSNWSTWFILPAYLLIPLVVGYILKRIGGFRFKDFDFIYSFTNPPTWYAAVMAICSYPILSFNYNKPSYLEYPWFCVIILFFGLLVIGTIIGSCWQLWPRRKRICNNGIQENKLDGNIEKFIEWLKKEEPIEDVRNDFFGSVTIAHRIARALEQKPIRRISLFGPYGCGKTSILNLAKKELKEQKSKIIIHIRAWGYEDKKLTGYILENSIKEISKYTDCLSLSLLSQKFQNIFLNNSWGIFDFLKFTFVFETPEELICKIDQVLKRLNMELIIFLEDIDRNQDNNVHHQLYSLFDYFSNVDSISFVVSYGGDI
jgi:hypothetical protein